MKRDCLIRLDSSSTRILLNEQVLGRPWKILIVGAGGSGSEMVDALARLDYALQHLEHPGLHITLQDPDEVSASNIGRQRFIPSDIGLNKARVLAERYGLLLGVDIGWNSTRAVTRHFAEFRDFDLIVTCVDRASVRTKIASYWAERRTEALWMDLGNGQYDGQVVLGHLGIPDAERLPNVLDLFPGVASTPDDDAPSCSVREALASQMIFVNRWMADAAASLLVQLATQGNIEHHGAFIDMRRLRVTPMAIGPDHWRFLNPGLPLTAPMKRKRGMRDAFTSH